MILWAIQARRLLSNPQVFSLRCFSFYDGSEHYFPSFPEAQRAFCSSVGFKMIPRERWTDEKQSLSTVTQRADCFLLLNITPSKHIIYNNALLLRMWSRGKGKLSCLSGGECTVIM